MKIKPLSFKGRMRRRDYLIVTLVIMILYSPVAVYIEYGTVSLLSVPIYLLAAALFVLVVFQIIKRLHDIGLKGLYWLVILIPVINIGFDLWLLLKPGMEGPNEYGEDPKSAVDTSEAPLSTENMNEEQISDS